MGFEAHNTHSFPLKQTTKMDRRVQSPHTHIYMTPDPNGGAIR
jgi:hypothetical protein